LKKGLTKPLKGAIINTERTKEDTQMLVIAYIVKMDGRYMNTFYNYTDACDERDRLARRWPMCRITIENADYYE